MDLLLKDLCWHNGIEMVSGDVRISKEIISEVGENLSSKKGEEVGNFENYYLYPGLINAHDHLEMNLYPKLGSPPYQNYIEWAKDIYHPTRSPLREIEKINIETRLLWGGLKNLIGGSTTVIHHNPWHRLLGGNKFPVNVLRVSWAHSLSFEKNISSRIPHDDGAPFVIHAGEGTDSLAFSEVTALHNLKLLNANTVLIHAIAMNDEQIQMLANSQTAVVWCPASNLYMFNQTAPIKKLKNKVRLSLGSDSTLTGSPTLLHEMKVAQQTQLATPFEIYEMVTRIPSQVFNLPKPSITVGGSADLFIAAGRSEDYFENLLKVEPGDVSLVITRGILRLKNASNNGKWGTPKNPVTIQGVPKFCEVDVKSIKKEITKNVSSEILERNPLWKLLQV